MFLSLFLTCGAAFAIYYFLLPDPEKVLQVYSQPGKWYWLKFRLMRFAIAHKQSKTAKETVKVDDLMNTEFGGGGIRSIKDLESKHTFPADKKSPAEAVFFDASNKEGYYFTLGTAQRKDNIINLFFILRVPGKGTFMAPEMLTNTNVQSTTSSSEWATKSGWKVKCIEPMKKWTISYNGKIVRSTGKRVFTAVGPEAEDILTGAEQIPATIEFTWTNFGDHFDFDKNISPTSIAHSLAKEPWSRELFEKLKDSHQSHYEQFGFLEGSLTIGGEKIDYVRMTSMRDHTITSYRNWSDLRRYIMMIYHLDDGTCIHTSLISMPETVFTQLEFGYVVTPDGKNYAVDRIHLNLADVGEVKGEFPQYFNYTFEAGPLKYDVKVNIIDTVSFKIGEKLETYVDENMATFETRDGLKGRGFIEAEYRITQY
ncbi:hypothetical protein PRIPAC_94490 [Pristionchus pacificus]|uniref:DUF7064 domain-containing protein n=1 Tax=Pristionchus pacificus TaxID=54126 RepID=A0A2A6BQZ1_PRIPA|nr:hypothetical protein PRIPAC_94490 [Pristionchus pacificus]|eukprot:PDM68171.1 hypothetical protein PRIPAC_46215 [Pristionchus pacificus]